MQKESNNLPTIEQIFDPKFLKSIIYEGFIIEFIRRHVDNGVEQTRRTMLIRESVQIGDHVYRGDDGIYHLMRDGETWEGFILQFDLSEEEAWKVETLIETIKSQKILNRL